MNPSGRIPFLRLENRIIKYYPCKDTEFKTEFSILLTEKEVEVLTELTFFKKSDSFGLWGNNDFTKKVYNAYRNNHRITYNSLNTSNRIMTFRSKKKLSRALEKEAIQLCKFVLEIANPKENNPSKRSGF